MLQCRIADHSAVQPVGAAIGVIEIRHLRILRRRDQDRPPGLHHRDPGELPSAENACRNALRHARLAHAERQVPHMRDHQPVRRVVSFDATIVIRVIKRIRRPHHPRIRLRCGSDQLRHRVSQRHGVTLAIALFHAHRHAVVFGVAVGPPYRQDLLVLRIGPQKLALHDGRERADSALNHAKVGIRHHAVHLLAQLVEHQRVHRVVHAIPEQMGRLAAHVSHFHQQVGIHLPLDRKIPVGNVTGRVVCEINANILADETGDANLRQNQPGRKRVRP